MKKSAIRVVGTYRKPKESYQTPYENNQFNRLDAFLRQEGFFCQEIAWIGSMPYKFTDYQREGFDFLKNRRKDGGPIRIIIPARLVLTEKSLEKYLQFASCYPNSSDPNNHYAIYHRKNGGTKYGEAIVHTKEKDFG